MDVQFGGKSGAEAGLLFSFTFLSWQPRTPYGDGFALADNREWAN